LEDVAIQMNAQSKLTCIVAWYPAVESMKALEPGAAMMVSSHALTMMAWHSISTLSLIMVRPVHEDVMEDVCCPANSVAMSMPVISSSFR
jgi:hypothetical protein